MFGILLLLFTIIPAIEIYLLINIGGQIGGMNTILVVIVTGIIGAALAKSQGILILNKIQTELGQGKMPANQIVHGLIVFAGGILLLTPGFLTDTMGLLMVFPGSRHLIVLYASKLFERAIKNGNVHFSSFGQSKGGFYSSTHNSNNDIFDADFQKQNDDNIIVVDFENKNEKND